MALIYELKRVDKERNSVHKGVEATYTLFSKEGNKYFQMDTFGTKERQIKGKVSQSIQLDRNNAIRLVEILKKEFDLY